MNLEQLTLNTEIRRVRATSQLDKLKQREYGQYFTSADLAVLVCSKIDTQHLGDEVRILDPGAGVGSLTVAAIAKIRSERPDALIRVTVVEIDPTVASYLRETLQDCEQLGKVQTELIAADFFELAPQFAELFDVVVQNPPYSKLPAKSKIRAQLEALGIVAPNLYVAFWALGIIACAAGGQCVAIVPRSWTNGVYFAKFRHWLLKRVAINALHTFDARDALFADNDVLQENIIAAVQVSKPQGSVRLARSSTLAGEVKELKVPFDSIVNSTDEQKFIRVDSSDIAKLELPLHTLGELGIAVSTGRVVAFRNRDSVVHDLSQADVIPFIQQLHIGPSEQIVWPLETDKPQGFRKTHSNVGLVVPPGNYVLVRRFSAKESPRRVVSAVWSSESPAAFDNKTNFLHIGGGGLDMSLAKGLASWLNSEWIDQMVRTFSGHTQINAADLKALPYPPMEALLNMGDSGRNARLP